MKLIIDIDENVRIAISRMGLLRISDEQIKVVDSAIQRGTPLDDTDTNVGKIDDDKKVSIGVLEQVMWERDVAIEQLKDLGYSLGEKPKTGHWVKMPLIEVGQSYSHECSECGRKILAINENLFEFPYCHCGARMVGDDNENDN